MDGVGCTKIGGQVIYQVMVIWCGVLSFLTRTNPFFVPTNATKTVRFFSSSLSLIYMFLLGLSRRGLTDNSVKDRLCSNARVDQKIYFTDQFFVRDRLGL